MSAQFVVRVLSYSLGKGVISLKGRRQRPWFEISRSELERTYLNHQLRTLRKLHDGPVDSLWDRQATNGFYDKDRGEYDFDYGSSYYPEEKTQLPDSSYLRSTKANMTKFMKRNILRYLSSVLGDEEDPQVIDDPRGITQDLRPMPKQLSLRGL